MTEIEMHNMNELVNKPAIQVAESGHLYIEILLGKYPAISDQEAQQILEFLTTAPAIDAALLTCNDVIAENLKTFKHGYRKNIGRI
ncbi:hypothetical protein AB1K62_14005 [Parasphingorhabdus sp. JC815]|uniref:hypothetical protein n=1 Tax=Parasphingorhabdus sp. JC815 TaxID=3232140 RepID=UPI00345B2DD8